MKADLGSRPWILRDVDPDRVLALSRALALPPIVSRILVARGFDEPSRAQAFLEASLGQMPDPATLQDIDRAAERLVRAVRDGEKITVYGDYDVDGVTSTAVLYLFFKHTLGVALDYYIPHRLKEGYGLNLAAIEGIAARGTRVLVTVDNGSSAVVECARAAELGLDVIIVDHHQVSDPEPVAYAHLNPHRKTCPYPDKVLAAVGVAFMLLVQVRRHLRDASFYDGPDPRPDRLLDLVALGTVADVAPLKAVNRAMTRRGVEQMKRHNRLGIEALMAVSKVQPDSMTARDLGYRLGPRINAAGRLDDATRGLRLLIGDDPGEARALAQEVEAQNIARRQIELEIVEAALAQVEGDEALLSAPALVLADESWHLGVVGIVASRMVERFHKPAILMARVGAEFKGSARSVPGLDIKAALDDCADLLTRYGGHVAAAGMSLPLDRFEAFRARFSEAVLARRGEVVGPPPFIADGEVDLATFTYADVEAIEALGPFGEGNRAPVLIARNVRGRARPLKQIHVKVDLQVASGPAEALGWNMIEIGPMFDGPVDLLFTPEVNVWRGRRKLVLTLKAVRAAAPLTGE